ncbi:hypothetical protein CERZMDRAFT_90772 [Cercospora zeae-maydis SCOH1-5]|uniref:Uncharacterized protein n=1 Tax=Cercospora zeae-maydis SCOH1-5 TaxID=717836 RepID=A0A6A6FEJ4_9PEZI|nr:hypothetical protein CERZMDRAFT_90772 [Cercospora zeae-maydis SCOH1-5]
MDGNSAIALSVHEAARRSRRDHYETKVVVHLLPKRLNVAAVCPVQKRADNPQRLEQRVE